MDGGARGNPGPSAVAAVASDGSGQELAERSAFIGQATNNVAEYKAVLLGLELAHELGASQVDVVNDSELVARQIEGRYKVKNTGLRPLYLQTLESLHSFEQWSVTSVRRESNERADQLVNEALDRERGGVRRG